MGAENKHLSTVCVRFCVDQDWRVYDIRLVAAAAAASLEGSVSLSLSPAAVSSVFDSIPSYCF